MLQIRPSRHNNPKQYADDEIQCFILHLTAPYFFLRFLGFPITFRPTRISGVLCSTKYPSPFKRDCGVPHGLRAVEIAMRSATSLPVGPINGANDHVIIADDLGCPLLKERGKVALQFVPVGDQQSAAGAEPSHLVQPEHAPIVNVDHQRQLLLLRLGLAHRAAGEPRVQVGVEEELVARRLLAEFRYVLLLLSSHGPGPLFFDCPNSSSRCRAVLEELLLPLVEEGRLDLMLLA